VCTVSVPAYVADITDCNVCTVSVPAYVAGVTDSWLMFPAGRVIVTSLNQRIYNHDKHSYVNTTQRQAEYMAA
jgi:hypothetical protein